MKGRVVDTIVYFGDLYTCLQMLVSRKALIYNFNILPYLWILPLSPQLTSDEKNASLILEGDAEGGEGQLIGKGSTAKCDHAPRVGMRWVAECIAARKVLPVQKR